MITCFTTIDKIHGRNQEIADDKIYNVFNLF